jgi:hypothetical protein
MSTYSLNLRSDLKRRLTINEMDGNFLYLQDLAISATAGPYNEDYYLQLSDIGKHIYKDDGDDYGVYIPTNENVAFPIGTAITVVSGNSWTWIKPDNSSTTELWGAGFNTTSNYFYIPDNSMATLLKIGIDKWMLSGAGLGNDD